MRYFFGDFIALLRWSEQVQWIQWTGCWNNKLTNAIVKPGRYVEDARREQHHCTEWNDDDDHGEEGLNIIITIILVIIL